MRCMLVCLCMACLALQAACSKKAEETARAMKVECSLPLPCDFDGLRLTFSHQPAPLKPFHINVTEMSKSNAIQSVSADFAMPDMAMGLNKYNLIKQDKAWAAEVMLPVCVQGRADWVMQLSVERFNGSRQYTVNFTSRQ